MYTNSFSVSGTFILLKAFKEQIEEGTNWQYDHAFTSFTPSQFEHCKDLYFNGREDKNEEWGSMKPQHFSLSNADSDEDHECFHLPQDWEKAIAFSKECTDELNKFLKILPPEIAKAYQVNFDRKSNTLSVGCQSYSKETVQNLVKITEGNYLGISTGYGKFDNHFLRLLLSIFK